jgi:hypothetical protein
MIGLVVGDVEFAHECQKVAYNEDLPLVPGSQHVTALVLAQAQLLAPARGKNGLAGRALPS